MDMCRSLRLAERPGHLLKEWIGPPCKPCAASPGHQRCATAAADRILRTPYEFLRARVAAAHISAKSCDSCGPALGRAWLGSDPHPGDRPCECPHANICLRMLGRYHEAQCPVFPGRDSLLPGGPE